MEILIYILILCFLTTEAFSWTQTVYNHCKWDINNQTYERRKKISLKTLCKFSLLSGIFSFLSWLFFIYLITLNPSFACISILFFVVSFFQIITIHTWYIISMYISIPIEFIPFISRQLFRVLYYAFDKCNFTDVKSLHSWDSVFEEKSSSNSLLINFIDVVPDMIWCKDNDNKFTFVNRSICRNLLLNDESHVIGKTSTKIAEEIRNRGIIYTFGELCCDSDTITRERRNPSLFYEYGYVDGKFMGLRVLKAPIFENGCIIGTIGVARNITTHIENYEHINNLFKEGKYEEGASLFLAYKQKFEAMQDIVDLNIIDRGIR